MSIFEASIDGLQKGLSSGAITSVELVAKYLHRISAHDCRGPALNSIPILNHTVFEDAAASDDSRAQGQHVRPLEGIPYTVKDSYKVKSMSAAAGSPAFRNPKASEDAFTVAAIRDAGGVLLGRTNMPPMADGGMQRGIYGRAENPYNPAYLAAAFASGSSNGSAVSVATSFEAFGMGEETVSSGRSPASNNALVAYTPSRGCVSIRGNWPLHPTCDVIVPHTRTMKEMLTLLDVVTQTDEITEGDFWRHQPFIHLPDELFPGKPDSFQDIAFHPTCRSMVFELRSHQCILAARHLKRGPLVARAWDAFLKANDDPEVPDLSEGDPLNIFPMRVRTAAGLAFLPMANDIHWTRLPAYAKDAGLYETEGLAEGLRAAAEAWRNGVKYSNGNRALRHLGVPTVSAPVGLMADKSMPVNLTFAGRAYDDVTLLKCATAYEATSRSRTAPAHTPPLSSDAIVTAEECTHAARPELIVEEFAVSTVEPKRISMRWVVKVDRAARASLETANEFPPFELTVDGCEVPFDNPVATKRSDTYVFELRDHVVPTVERVAVKPTEEPVVRDMVIVEVPTVYKA
ncbi:hypothetical protein INS49_006249 [Diaporthe citri]|uniref:uncharacterized protein n=1 Tax=Diaporthe citri TaxID=83186 RepID=UPI001C7EA44C|nr:uncharacterized protein INS49_006249 [Diaporthe citri]KAG6364646.1 hypothetical protein INS49_006249 [Diaporthe citri]